MGLTAVIICNLDLFTSNVFLSVIGLAEGAFAQHTGSCWHDRSDWYWRSNTAVQDEPAQPPW